MHIILFENDPKLYSFYMNLLHHIFFLLQTNNPTKFTNATELFEAQEQSSQAWFLSTIILLKYFNKIAGFTGLNKVSNFL